MSAPTQTPEKEAPNVFGGWIKWVPDELLSDAERATLPQLIPHKSESAGPDFGEITRDVIRTRDVE